MSSKKAPNTVCSRLVLMASESSCAFFKSFWTFLSFNKLIPDMPACCTAPGPNSATPSINTSDGDVISPSDANCPAASPAAPPTDSVISLRPDPVTNPPSFIVMASMTAIGMPYFNDLFRARLTKSGSLIAASIASGLVMSTPSPCSISLNLEPYESPSVVTTLPATNPAPIPATVPKPGITDPAPAPIPVATGTRIRP